MRNLLNKLRFGLPRARTVLLASAAGWVMVPGQVLAAEIPLDVPDLSVRLDNTVKYSNAFRTSAPSNRLRGSLNQDDGNRNFERGLVSNRFDWLGELDMAYKNVGARVSAAAWYDTVYNQGNDNSSSGTFNGLGRNDHFAGPTKRLHGRDVELLDAFVYAKGNLGADHPGLVRAGRHSLLFGESLFFGSNGIAAAQQPIDIAKAQSVPSSTFKEIVRPVNQVSGQIQVAPGLTLGGYYQLEWEKNVIPAAGSYFSGSDILDDGGERLLTGGGRGFFRGEDLYARDTGQFGVQLRYNAESIDTDFGLYAARYHDKSAKVYMRAGDGVNLAIGKIGTYQLVYPEDIEVYGASVARNIGVASVTGEISTRRNMPLISPGQSIGTTAGDNSKNPRYAVGKSLHGQVSLIYPLPRTGLWESGTLSAEVAWNRRLSITKNRSAIDPLATQDAVATRTVFSPGYSQVLPELDINIPISLGYSPYGHSSVVNNFGVEHGGDFGLGVTGTYQQVWRFGINYTYYFGPVANTLNSVNTNTFRQNLADRDFLSMSVQRSF